MLSGTQKIEQRQSASFDITSNDGRRATASPQGGDGRPSTKRGVRASLSGLLCVTAAASSKTFRTHATARLPHVAVRTKPAQGCAAWSRCGQMLRGVGCVGFGFFSFPFSCFHVSWLYRLVSAFRPTVAQASPSTLRSWPCRFTVYYREAPQVGAAFNLAWQPLEADCAAFFWGGFFLPFFPAWPQGRVG